MFVGYDTGHDNSGRLDGFAHPGNHGKNAAVPPDDDNITPIIAVDMACNYYATLTALSEMAEILGDSAAAGLYKSEAKKRRKTFSATVMMRRTDFSMMRTDMETSER